jgi:hypothetical protein
MFWLDGHFQLRSIEPYHFQWGIECNGYRVQTESDAGNMIRIFKENDQAKVDFFIELPHQTRPVLGGAWYQSDALFFYDANGDLHVIDHPSASQGTPIAPETIKGADAAKLLIVNDPQKRFAGLVWSERYGLMRNGFPLCRIYNKDWQTFFLDQRDRNKAKPDKDHQLVPTNWLNAANLVEITDDGVQYWGGYGSFLITQNGYLIKNLALHGAGGVVLPNGDLVTQASPFRKGVFDVSVIRRTW